MVLMPTGGGKSLIYQIAAMARDGMGLVISPLIALMKDQVEGLQANGVRAAYLNSSLPAIAQSEVKKAALNGQLQLLYISPERLMTRDFYDLIRSVDLSLIAVDEAHCISEWGHDFRPEYARMGFLTREFPQVPMIALTATADRLTRDDIIQQLGLRQPRVFISSFDRPNLQLTVLPAKNRYQLIRNYIEDRLTQSGIVYCLSRKQTEELAEKLNHDGIQAVCYHAGLPAQERNGAQNAFLHDRVNVICATVAFGMGIDKSNIRWVIHYNLPKNIENYYQEIGRAGRDGLPAQAVLFYTYRDVITLKSMIEDSKQHQVLETKLERMQQYADAVSCRRRILLNYFNEPVDRDCGNCDVCLNPPESFDGTLLAQMALSAVVRLKQQEATGMVIDVLRGAYKRELLDKKYHEIPTWGAGKDYGSWEWQQYFLQLLHLGLLDLAYDQNNALRLTALSKEVLFNGKTVQLIRPAEAQHVLEARRQAASRVKTAATAVPGLFDQLRILRKRLAEESGLAPYRVFSDATLHAMAREKPQNRKQLEAVSGVGQYKLDTYGDAFLAVLNQSNSAGAKGQRSRGDTQLKTLQLYKLGYSPEAIARHRKMALVTVFSHFASLYENQYDVDIQAWVETREVEQVAQVVGKMERPSLKMIHQQLNSQLPYHRIRLALAILARERQ